MLFFCFVFLVYHIILLIVIFFLFVGVLCNFFIIHKNKHKICFISSSKLLFLLKWHMQWKHSSTKNNKNTIMKKPLSAVVWKSNARLEVEGGNASGNPFIKFVLFESGQIPAFWNTSEHRSVLMNTTNFIQFFFFENSNSELQ